MIAVWIATLSAVCAGYGCWWIDQRLLRCESKARATLASILLAMGTWVCILIQAMIIFRVQGAYGPVQFWSPEDATSMTGPRMLAGVFVLLGFVVAAVTLVVAMASMLRPSDTDPARRLIMPTVSTMVIALAGYCYHHYGLLPTA